MRLVILESPYAANSLSGLERNKEYLQIYIRDSVLRGESPYASHQMLTGAFNDQIEVERALGIAAGLCWAERADAVVVYEDYGISPGMEKAIEIHTARGRKIERRNIL